MSSEVVTLLLDAPVRQPARVWRQLWDLAWRAVAIDRYPACRAFAREYFEDLLPDQQSVLMGCDERELRWQFSDFGGAFSPQIGVLARWFELGLASEYAAVHRAVEAAGGAVAWRHARTVADVLRPTAPIAERTRGRPMLLARDRLSPLSLEGEVVSIAGLTDCSAEERARAAQLWASDRTDDPIERQFAHTSARASVIAEREAFDRKRLLRHAEQLEARARERGASDEALLDAIVSAAADERDRDGARVWLEKHLALARALPGREALSARLTDAEPAVRQLAAATLAHAAKSARSSEKDGVPVWIARALASEDPVIVEHALSVELDSKRTSDALIAAALAHEALLQRSISAGEGLVAWIAARDPKTASAATLALIERATLTMLGAPGRAALDRWLVLDGRTPPTATRRHALHAALRTPLSPGQSPWRLAWLSCAWSEAASVGVHEREALAWIADARIAASALDGAAARSALWRAWMRVAEADAQASTREIRAALLAASPLGSHEGDEALSTAIHEDFVNACGNAVHHARDHHERARVSGAIVALCVHAIEARAARPPHPTLLSSLHRAIIAALERTADRWAAEPRRLAGCDRCAAALESLARAWEPSSPEAAALARTLAANTDVRG